MSKTNDRPSALIAAYHIACKDIVRLYPQVELESVRDAMVEAIIDLSLSGKFDPEALARYAVGQALTAWKHNTSGGREIQ